MPVTVTRTQSRTLQPGPLYQVLDTCTAANSFDTAIYVYALADDSFSHVATTRDLLTYPATRAAAVTEKASYYRLPSVTFQSASVQEAVDFGDSVTVRVQTLCNEFQYTQDEFLGDGQPITITTTGRTGVE